MQKLVGPRFDTKTIESIDKNLASLVGRIRDIEGILEMRPSWKRPSDPSELVAELVCLREELNQLLDARFDLIVEGVKK